MLTRRTALRLTGTAALAAAHPARAEPTAIRVGIDLSLTGADAESAGRIKNGVIMALDEANAAGGVAGYSYFFEPMTLDDATAAAGQYDPAQAATNARKMIADRSVVAAIGPQMSGAAKAMAPILSQGNLAMITPAATNPDLTNPRFAAQYRPAGRTVFFRTVTTDAFQGPNMANFFADALKVGSVYVLDDSGAYGVGLADAFQAQAARKGIKVAGRDRLNPLAADYAAVLTKIKASGAQALYFGGVMQAGVKLVKQSYEIVPQIIKAGGDGLYGPEMATAAGFPAAEGWYVTNASPHMTDNPLLAKFVARFRQKFGTPADDYTITAYDGALVIIDAVRRVAASGQPVTRDAVRDAIAGARLDTLQGLVSFDPNGDIVDRVVAVFQVHHDAAAPLDDINRQFRYIGVAPEA